MSNISVFNDPFMRALLNICQKENVKKYFSGQKGSYHETLDKACFLAANGITDFGANDNEHKKRRKTSRGTP